MLAVAPRTSLTIDGVSKSYKLDGIDRQVLRNVSFSVANQEIVGVLGASGCGKSTLLRLIIGLDREFDGSIEVDGKDNLAGNSHIGMVFQDHRLFPWLTVEGNVALALDALPLSPSERARRVRHYIELVGLSDFAKAYPKQLSGGMAQRAAIARALAPEPDILLMDEPFGALDSLLRIRLQDELLRIWEKHKISIVIVTHDVEEALYLSDRVIVMEANPGRIRDVLDVGLGRPRSRDDAKLASLKRRCLETLIPA